MFFAVHVLPGNFAAQQFAGANLGSVTAEAVAQAEAVLGLDKPVLEQYDAFLWNLVQFDLGESFRCRRSVRTELGRAMILVLELDLFRIDVDGQPHLWEDPELAL